MNNNNMNNNMNNDDRATSIAEISILLGKYGQEYIGNLNDDPRKVFLIYDDSAVVTQVKASKKKKEEYRAHPLRNHIQAFVKHVNPDQYKDGINIFCQRETLVSMLTETMDNNKNNNNNKNNRHNKNNNNSRNRNNRKNTSDNNDDDIKEFLNELSPPPPQAPPPSFDKISSESPLPPPPSFEEALSNPTTPNSNKRNNSNNNKKNNNNNNNNRSRRNQGHKNKTIVRMYKIPKNDNNYYLYQVKSHVWQLAGNDRPFEERLFRRQGTHSRGDDLRDQLIPWYHQNFDKRAQHLVMYKLPQNVRLFLICELKGYKEDELMEILCAKKESWRGLPWKKRFQCRLGKVRWCHVFLEDTSENLLIDLNVDKARIVQDRINDLAKRLKNMIHKQMYNNFGNYNSGRRLDRAQIEYVKRCEHELLNANWWPQTTMDSNIPSSSTTTTATTTTTPPININTDILPPSYEEALPSYENVINNNKDTVSDEWWNDDIQPPPPPPTSSSQLSYINNTPPPPSSQLQEQLRRSASREEISQKLAKLKLKTKKRSSSRKLLTKTQPNNDNVTSNMNHVNQNTTHNHDHDNTISDEWWKPPPT